MYSISTLCTVGLDRTDQAFPPIGRIEDLRVVKTILPEDLKALATPRSGFPVSGSGQVVIFFPMCFRMAVCGGIVTPVDMPVSHREAIALSVGVAIALDMTVAVTFSIVITLTLHKAIASIIFIRMICGVVI